MEKDEEEEDDEVQDLRSKTCSPCLHNVVEMEVSV